MFARSYRLIAFEMQRAINAGEFEDSPWMTLLDIIFAQEYFDAVEAYKQGEEQLPNAGS